jgi:hypothetical protein
MSSIRTNSVSSIMRKLIFCSTQTSSQTMCLASNQTSSQTKCFMSLRLCRFQILLSEFLLTEQKMFSQKTLFASFSECRTHALRKRFVWSSLFYDSRTFFETFFATNAAKSWKNLIFIKRKFNMNWTFFFVNVCKFSKFVLWFIAWISIAFNMRRCD